MQPYPFPASNDSVHDDLVDWIAEEGLGGDRDAAEWVLLACIARVYAPDYTIYLLLLIIDIDNRGNLLCFHLLLPSPGSLLQNPRPRPQLCSMFFQSYCRWL